MSFVGWIIGIFLVLVTAGIIIYFAVIRPSIKEPEISEEQQEALDKLADNADIIINFAERTGNVIYKVSTVDGKNLGGNMNYKAFPRDIAKKDGIFTQDPDSIHKIFVHKGRSCTMADRTRSPLNIGLLLPKYQHELPEGELGNVLRPYLTIKEPIDSIVKALIEEGKTKEELMMLIGKGTISEMALKQVKNIQSALRMDEMAKEAVEKSFPL